jgi:cbb3-type cytochrome oxidase cytochrome c subunit
MKNGLSIFVAAFFLLGLSWCSFVLTPVLQLGGAKQAMILNTSDAYPVQRSGNATLGLQVYRANGCAACHTEQIQQTGMTCEVVVTGLGKNARSVQKILGEISGTEMQLTTNELPKTILSNVPKEKADAISDKITAAGGKVETRIFATGSDISRGWGVRRSVAEDFLWDSPVQLGGVRVGPDLANVGARYDMNWQLLHLYAPQAIIKGSVMPPFRFLFEKRKKVNGDSSSGALLIPMMWPKDLLPPDGYEIVPTEDAKNLVAYLLSLHADVPLHDAPFTPPAEKKKQ